MIKIKHCGIFDSGLGGYTVFRALRERFPKASFVLYADHANAPYGNQSNAMIIDHTLKAMAWFQAQGIQNIIVACNTVSSIAMQAVHDAFPDLNVYGIIDMTVEACNVSAPTQVAVVSTQATYNSNAYVNALHERGVKDVVPIALPELVNIIEGMDKNKSVQTYLSTFKNKWATSTDLILGCTHYPIVKEDFLKMFDGNIHDSIHAVVTFVEKTYTLEDGNSTVWTTGDPLELKQQIQNLFHEKVEVKGL